MRRTRFGHLLAVALVVGWLAPLAHAQDTKSARGTVSALSNGSITVKVGSGDVVYAVDAKTVLEAPGAGTADRRADAAGKPGPQLRDFVKVGDAVEVSYVEGGATARASRVRRVSSAGAASAPDEKSMTQSGTVSSLTGSTLTITGSGGGVSSFTQSFTVNRETKVVAVGAGTAAAASGGGIPIASAVGVGDQVTVTYRQAGATLHAEEVRVTAKKK
jgi:hypothetical protein